MKVTKSIIAVLLCLSAGSAYADCEYYLTGNKETLNISDCVDGVKGIANSALSNSQNAQNKSRSGRKERKQLYRQ